MNKRLFKTLGFLVFLFSLSACSGSSDQTSMSDQIKQYCEKDTTSSLDGQVSAYFDFSDGLYYAYRNDSTKETLKSIVNKITGDLNTKIYSLANDTILPLDKHQTQLYNAIIDDASYNNKNAPIEKTLAKIVKEGHSSFLVTDFEEFTKDGVTQHQAFAKPYFEEWLKRGNDITFFVTDYKEGALNKHLYYIVFDKGSHNLLSKIEEALEGKSVNFKRFLLSTNPCQFTTNYPASTKGGCYHDENGDDVVSATVENGDGESFNKFEGLKAEFYPFGDSWKNIINNAKSMKEQGVAKPFTDLFRNLFVDLSNQDSYVITKMAVKAYNVQSDFDKFEAFKDALKNKPKMVKDENGSLVADLSGDAENYYDEKGNMKPEIIYKPQPLNEIQDMFILNETLYNNTFKANRQKVELGIDFNPQFSGQIVGYNDGDLIRVDIVIGECTPNYTNLDALFSWGGNHSLSEAIRNTLQDLNPTGQCIYSYFIKTN